MGAMELFADDDQFNRLEARFAAAGVNTDISLHVSLGWQLRQRDPGRALALALETERRLVEFA